MEREYVVLTADLIHAGGGPSGAGFTAAQLAVFGVPWPPQKGWLSKLVGRRVTAEEYRRFLAAHSQRVRKPKGVGVSPSLFDEEPG